MKKSFSQAFTLLELIFVIILLSLLIGMGITKLSSSGADRFNAESCVNTFFAPLASWGYYAASSKMLSGEITPDFYIIQKEGPSSGYVLTYKIGDTEEEYQKKLTSTIAYCQKGGNYRVKVDFNFDRVVLRPSLYAYGDQRGFEILSGATSLATGVIAFDFCSPSTSTECTDF